MSKVMKRIRESFKRALESLLPSGECSLLVAFSGGKDSVTLLNLLREFAGDGVKVAVAYVNHNLRDEESEQEEAFVCSYIESLGLPLYVKSVDPALWQKGGGESVEMKARRIRYSFFKRLLKEHSFDYIVTAHHFNDRIESFFIQLLRGGGFETLRSIPAVNGRVIRPLLEVSREQIERYVEEGNLPFVEDSSNSKNIYRRNVIRNRLIPLLQEIYPAYKDSFSHVFSFIDEEQALVKRLVAGHFKRLCFFRASNVVAIKLTLFKGLDFTLKKYLLKLVLKKLGYPIKPVKSFFDSLTIDEATFSYSKGRLRVRSKGKLLWFWIDPAGDRGSLCEKLLLNQIPKKIESAELLIKVEMKKNVDKTTGFVFKYNMADFPLAVKRPTGKEEITLGRQVKRVANILKDNSIPAELAKMGVTVESADGRVIGFSLFHLFRLSSPFYVEDEGENCITFSFNYL